jgi:beta-carotene hydroxylase
MTQAEAARTSTIKIEAEIARRHTPDFGWQTVWLFLALFAVFAVSSYGAVAGLIPVWLGAAINTVFIYALYTVVHEAVHGNISLRKTHLRWLDVVIGAAACVPLWLFFTHHKRSHRLHHTRCNEDDDPDIYSRGGFAGWCFVRLPRTLLNYFNPFNLYRECRRFGLSNRATAFTLLNFAAYAAVVVGLVAAGYGYEVLVLWFIPWWIGQFVMLTLFTWTPHHDHSETGRYRNTRVSVWPGGNLLLLGQGYHLIHHMIPSVPYYRYEATFEEMRPILEQKGVRIEGFWPRPVAKPASA